MICAHACWLAHFSPLTSFEDSKEEDGEEVERLSARVAFDEEGEQDGHAAGTAVKLGQQAAGRQFVHLQMRITGGRTD